MAPEPPAAPRLQPADHRARTFLGGVLLWLAGRGRAWGQGRRDRRLLAGFNDWMLRDIGLERRRTDEFYASSFWRLR